MKQDFYEVTENEQIAPSVFKMALAGDTSPITAPGQFVNIKIPEFYLRRPISICDWNSNTLTIIYKVVGDGTSALSRIKKGEKLGCFCIFYIYQNGGCFCNSFTY